MVRDALIISDSEILGGIPVFTGTRVPVKCLIDYIKSNHPLGDFLDDFPTVSRVVVCAVLDSFSDSFIQTPREDR